MSELTLAQVKVQPIPGTNQAAKFDLSLELVQRNETLNGTFVFNTELFEAETISCLATHYQVLLEALVEHPTKAVNHLPLLSSAEQQELVTEWNAPISREQSSPSIHHLLEAQVTRTPEAVALVEGDLSVTYAAVNQRANELAHFLQIQGVGPEARVALCLERGIDLIVSMLGILKAGGAYVPLDPTTPIYRLSFILQDANVSMVVTSGTLKEKLEDELGSSGQSSFSKYPVMTMDEAWLAPANTGTLPSQPEITGENLAYLMYTSGSTGQPKGVEIPHCAVISPDSRSNISLLAKASQLSPISFPCL